MTRSGRALWLSIAALLVYGAIAVAAPARPRLIPISDSSLVNVRSSNPQGFFALGPYAYFMADDGTHGPELWRTDGTAAGTIMLADAAASIYAGGPTIAGSVGTRVVFTEWDGTETAIWSSDGSPAGTIQLAITPAPQPYANGYFVESFAAGSLVFVLVQLQYGSVDLWATDGTVAGTHDIGVFAGGLNPAPVGANGKLFFVEYDTTVGQQLWVSDGTLLGTHMVRQNIECPGDSCNLLPKWFFTIGSSAYFTTADAIWRTDGTAAGTSILAPFSGGVPIATSATVAYLNNTITLLRTDGTTTTQMPFPAPFGSRVDKQILDDGRFLTFHGNSGAFDLWKTDATPAGTALVTTMNPDNVHASAQPRFVGHLANQVFYSGFEPTTGWELWRVDADAATTALIKDIDDRLDIDATAFSGSPGSGIAFNSGLLFPASDANGRELWFTDGTTAGTNMVANIAAEAPSGIISGTVRDAVTNAVIPGATVWFCATDCSDVASTDANGHYRFEGVTPGTYTVKAGSSLYVSQAYSGIDCPCTPATGTPVTVTAGFETADVDFTLKLGGWISGSIVRAATGDFKGGFYLYVRDASGSIVDQPLVAGTGTYRTRGLPPGSYTIETHWANYGSGVPLVDQVYNSHNCLPACDWSTGDPVAVTLGTQTPNINLSLHDYGTISGTVRDASNLAPAEGLQVDFVRQGGSTYPSVYVTTAADGTYTSPLLNPGLYYVRAVPNAGYNGVVYPNAPCASYSCDPTGGALVSVAVDSHTTGIDMQLTQPQGRITGTITDRNGAPFPSVPVALHDSSGYVGYVVPQTTSTGRYVFFGLPAGTYYLQAVDELAPNVDCYDNPCNVTGATPVTVALGQTYTLDLQSRSQRSTLGGVVRDASTSHPIPPAFSVSVNLVPVGGERVFSLSGVTYTSAYQLTVISRATTFYVNAVAGGYHARWYPNVDAATCTSCTPPAGAVAVPAGTTNGDLELPPFGAIAGTVTNAVTGLPVSNISVALWSGGTVVGSVVTDSNGNYRWQNANGSYNAYITSYSYVGQVYRDHDCAASCDPSTGDAINVTDGTVVNGIDFHLQPHVVYGKITGRVVDDVTGAGMENVYVSAPGTGYSTRTDSVGNYTLDNLPAGSYRLYAQTVQPYFVALYGGAACTDLNTCNFNNATALQVNPPNTASAADIRMIELQIASISPAWGSTAGGTQVTVTGTNFTPQATLKIGTTPATIVSVSPTQIVAVTQAMPAGVAHVTAFASPWLSITLAHAFSVVQTPFTDDPIVAGATVVKAVHVTQLRSAIDTLRASASLPPYAYTDATLTDVAIKATHILELRTALDQARATLALPQLTYAHGLTAGESPISAIDIMELRDALR